MKASEILREARAKIAKPEAWTQGAMARNAKGWIVHVSCWDAMQWCAIGAIDSVAIVAAEGCAEVFLRRAALLDPDASAWAHEGEVLAQASRGPQAQATEEEAMSLDRFVAWHGEPPKRKQIRQALDDYAGGLALEISRVVERRPRKDARRRSRGVRSRHRVRGTRH